MGHPVREVGKSSATGDLPFIAVGLSYKPESTARYTHTGHDLCAQILSTVAQQSGRLGNTAAALLNL